jgi:drug/metabolite transporter (DMT)-like permease
MRIKGVILVILGSSLWGISGTVAEYLFQVIHFPMDTLVMLRMTIAGALILSYLHFAKGIKIFEIWAEWPRLLAFSIVGMMGVQYAYFAAIQYGNAATATILQYLSPAMIAVYMALKHRRKPSRQLCAGIGLAMLGTFLIVTSGRIDAMSIAPRAFFWGIVSAMTAAFYTVQPQKMLKKYGALRVVGWGMLIGGSVFALIKRPWHSQIALPGTAYLAVIFVIVFGTLLAFTLYLESTRYITPTETSILASAEPLSAAILSVLWLGNRLLWIQWLGMLLVMATIAIISSESSESSEGAKQ